METGKCVDNMTIEEQLTEGSPLSCFSVEELANEICSRYESVLILCQPLGAVMDTVMDQVLDEEIEEGDIPEGKRFFNKVNGNPYAIIGMAHEFACHWTEFDLNWHKARE